MKYLKEHIEFIKESDDAKFEFLAMIPQYEKYILRMVEIHEQHYYKDVKISTNPEFIKGIKEFSKKMLNKENVMAEDYLSIIRKYEKELYQKNEFGIPDDESGEYMDESMFGILDDIVSSFRAIVRRDFDGSQSAIRTLKYFKKDINDDRMDDSWVYKQTVADSMASWADDDMDYDPSTDPDQDNYDPLDDLWQSNEEFIADIEGHVGKKFDDFSYVDKMSAFDYIKSKRLFIDMADVPEIQEMLGKLKEMLGV